MKIAFHTSKGSASQPQFWPDYWKTVSVDLNPRYLPEYSALMRQLKPGSSVLDIGCGRGLLVRDLLSKGYYARGIDFDGDSIFDSVAHAGYFPSEVGDLNHLPYRDEAFDAVLLAGTVEHVFTGVERGFFEAFRVLRPGGSIVLTIPYINLVRKVLLPFYAVRDTVFSWFPEQRQQNFFEWVFTRSEVVRMLLRAGFTITECRRAYYTTTLRKIPGFVKVHSLVFGQSSANHSPNGSGPGIAKSQPSGAKQLVKRAVEGALNLTIANRLLVVARRPAY